MKKINSKGIFIADPHFTDKNPPNRIDNYLDAISLKFQESLEIAKNLKVDYVVILGDLFDTYEPSAIVRNRVIDIISKGNNFNKWPFEIFLVVGNHDIYGKNPQTMDMTAIKTLEAVGLLKICDVSDKYGIYFGHYKNDIEKEKVDTDLPILAMHSNIVHTPAIFSDSILIKDFWTNENNKLVISGHYHAGYNIIKKEPGLFFANPGSLGRLSITDANNHLIQIAMVELKDSEVYNIEYIALHSAQPCDMVFDMKTVKENKKQKVDITEFINSIDNAKLTVSNDTNIIDGIKEYGKKINVEQEIIDEAIKRVSDIKIKEEDNDE